MRSAVARQCQRTAVMGKTKKVEELTGGGRVLGKENIGMHSKLVLVIGNIPKPQ